MNIEDKKKSERKIKYVNAGKNLFMIFIIGSTFMFQVFWFSLAENFSITYDIETYNEKYPNAQSFGDFVDSVFGFMRDNPINFSQAAEDIIETNATFISELEDEANQSISRAQEVFDCFLNNNISESSIIVFIGQMWKNAKNVIPADFLNPAKIIMQNRGIASIKSISFKGIVIINNRSAVFLENLNNKLSRNEDLIIQITLKQLIVTAINLGIDLFVDLTLQVLKTPPHKVYNNTLTYFKDFANNFEFSLSFSVSGVLGLLPLSLYYSIELSTIFKHLNI